MGRELRHCVNPLAGISIPTPLFQVPTEEPCTTSSVVLTSTTRTSKSQKLMVASPDLLMPWNLFACDYLQEHSPTTSEFKAVWDNIDPKTKRKYKALSKQKKSAAHLTSNATTPTSNNASTVTPLPVAPISNGDGDTS
ncbi:hypothetical protein DFH94DRAFT_681002 [Russula ochroleuca]|uniref:Uncharacterized protein n=1 Tax=Russula ochroleuca TaxID=152965 RepID=A0A9P5MY79_9AGAM|nr:hypothetical protein DFH94DRAFT_681002 [Russula ochroleuca]